MRRLAPEKKMCDDDIFLIVRGYKSKQDVDAEKEAHEQIAPLNLHFPCDDVEHRDRVVDQEYQ